MTLLSKKHRDEINRYGIFLTDIYYLNYYGINVFFQVCKTEYERVCLVELKTKIKKIDGEKREVLTKRLLVNKDSQIIPKNSTYTQSSYRVTPTKIPEYDTYVLPIRIDYFSDFRRNALDITNQYCSAGIAYAVPLNEYLHKYWNHLERRDVIRYA